MTSEITDNGLRASVSKPAAFPAEGTFTAELRIRPAFKTVVKKAIETTTDEVVFRIEIQRWHSTVRYDTDPKWEVLSTHATLAEARASLVEAVKDGSGDAETTSSGLTIITNNAFDTVLVRNATGTWAHTIAGAQFWQDALTVGDDQDIDNWSGDAVEDGMTAADFGDIVATNDGTTLTVVDEDLFAERNRFYLGDE